MYGPAAPGVTSRTPVDALGAAALAPDDEVMAARDGSADPAGPGRAARL